MTMLRSVCAALLFMSLAACDSTKESAKPIPPVGFATTVVNPQTTAVSRWWDGVIAAKHQATLSAQTSGRVASMKVDVNDRVSRGQVLLQLTDSEQRASVDQAKAGLRVAEAANIEAELGFNRAKDMLSKKLIAQSVFDQAKARVDSTRAALDAAKADLSQANSQVSYTQVRAPFDGVVSARMVQAGESVSPGQVLLSVFSRGDLRAEVSIPQQQLSAVQNSKQATIELNDGRRLTSENITVFPAADDQSHSVMVRVELGAVESPPQPGQSVKLAFANEVGFARITIPRSAIQTRGEVHSVYVIDAKNRVSLRHVRLGVASGDSIEVSSGLQAGERVATRALDALAHLRGREGGAKP